MFNVITTNQKKSPFDVRSNLFALLSINIAVLSNDNSQWLPIIFFFIVLLLALAKAWHEILIVITYGLGLAALLYLSLALSNNIVSSIFYASLRLTAPFITTGCMAYYFIKVTPPNLLLTGLYKLRCPHVFIVPFAVMFRLIPTVNEEAIAIKNAMCIRGLSGIYWLRHPIKMLEYFLIPLILATIRSGEALTASALMRGLGRPNKRTSIIKLHFSWYDNFLIITCCLILIISIAPSRLMPSIIVLLISGINL